MLDLAGGQPKMRCDLDGARRPARVDKVLVDPEPDLRVTGGVALCRAHSIKTHCSADDGDMSIHARLDHHEVLSV
jgi:hypothetical protein